MRRFVALALAASALAVAAPARAQDAVLTAAGLQYLPGDEDLGVPLEIERGSDLRFINLDVLGYHTVTSEADEGGVKLFDTPDQLGPGETALVEGVEALPPGTYRFYCSTHYPTMWGVLVVE